MLDPMVPAMGRIYNTFPNKCLITCRGQEIQERMILTPVVDHTRLAVKISLSIGPHRYCLVDPDWPGRPLGFWSLTLNRMKLHLDSSSAR